MSAIRLFRRLSSALAIKSQVAKDRFEQFFHLGRGVGEQQVEDQGEVDADAADDLVRPGREHPGHQAQVHVAAWHGKGKADLVHSPATGPAGHLVKLGGIQGDELRTVEAVRVEKHHGPGREIDACGHGGGGKDGGQQALAHQTFDHQLPAGEVTAVVGADAGPLQVNALAVPGQVRRTVGQRSNPVGNAGRLFVAQVDGPMAQAQGGIAVAAGF